jgi:hypothetical protein
VLRTTKTEAMSKLRECLSSLPTDEDARSDFFLLWKARVTAGLEAIFGDHSKVVQQFKEIEFSPRLLAGDEERDAQIKQEAFRAGCAAAKAMMEALLEEVDEYYVTSPLSTGEILPAAEDGRAEQAPESDLAFAAAEAAEQMYITPAVTMRAAAPGKRHAPASDGTERIAFIEAPAPAASRAVERPEAVVSSIVETPAPLEIAVVEPPRVRPETPVAVPPPAPVAVLPQPRPAAAPATGWDYLSADSNVTGTLKGRDLLVNVRTSLGRVLSAWDRGDRGAAAVVSAQLLADLSVLSRDHEFAAALNAVASKAYSPASAPEGMEHIKDIAPLCVWSVVLAMTQVM